MTGLSRTLAACGAALLAGCATVEISSPGSMRGITMPGATTPADRSVIVYNSGCHLFWWWTLWSGDLRWDEAKDDIAGGVALFRNCTGMDDAFSVLQHVAAREKCDLVDVVFTDASRSDLSVSSAQGLLQGLLGISDVMASAVLRPRPPAAEGGAE